MSAEAFLLLTLPQATINNSGKSNTGPLALECVTISDASLQESSNRGVYLVLRVNNTEWPIDPTQIVTFSTDPNGARDYNLWGADQTQIMVTIRLPTGSGSRSDSDEAHVLEDMDTFHELLAQYAIELRDESQNAGDRNVRANSRNDSGAPRHLQVHAHDAMRGHVVLINEESGEVVGELDNKLVINEDPRLHEKGRENEPVLVELSGDDDDGDLDARTVFVRAIPPEEQNWLTKSASLASHVISGTTNLLITTMGVASSYYINHSTPHPSANSANTASGQPPPLPPRALVFLTAESTRKGLSTVHTISAQAATISSKTASLVDDMIKRAVGAKTRNQPTNTPASDPSTSTNSSLLSRIASSAATSLKHSPSGDTLKPPLPPRSLSRTPSPPPYPLDKPPLPSRQTGQSRAPSPQPPPLPTTPRPRIRTRERLLLSADLVLSAIDSSMQQFVEASSENLGRAVEHKYGHEAAVSAGLLTGSAKNIVAIYIDMRGIGRRAIIKRVGKEFVRARLGDLRDHRST